MIEFFKKYWGHILIAIGIVVILAVLVIPLCIAFARIMWYMALSPKLV